MAGVSRVPVVVARVAVEQSVSAAAHTLDDAGAGGHGRHVLAGHCRHDGQGYRPQHRRTGPLKLRMHLPTRPFSRVNERLVNMHSKATRWKTLLTVL